MKRIALLLLAVLALTSCNRFDDSFGVTVEKFFDNYRTAIEHYAAAGDSVALAALSGCYAVNYLNNGLSRDDVLADFSDIVGATELTMTLTRYEETSTGARIQWHMSYVAPGDSYDFSVVDVLQRSGGDYILVGNHTSKSIKEYAELFAAVVRLYVVSTGTSIDNWFAADYYHNGQTQDSVMVMLGDLKESATTNMETSVTSVDAWTQDFTIHFSDDLAGIYSDLSTRARVNGSDYILCGNQRAATDESKQKVFVELFTATWCTNCPIAEQALLDLKEEYGDRLLYVEYHVSDEFDCGNVALHNWYSTGTAPTGVFQGQSVIIGATTTLINTYRNKVNIYAAQDAHAFITGFSHTLNDTEKTGTVSLSLDSTVPTDNLYLKWALVDESAQGNNGNPYHQVVTARGQMALSGENLSQPVTFPFTGVSSLPDNPLVYVWLQTVTDDYTPSVNKIYNAAEFSVE